MNYQFTVQFAKIFDVDSDIVNEAQATTAVRHPYLTGSRARLLHGEEIRTEEGLEIYISTLNFENVYFLVPPPNVCLRSYYIGAMMFKLSMAKTAADSSARVEDVVGKEGVKSFQDELKSKFKKFTKEEVELARNDGSAKATALFEGAVRKSPRRGVQDAAAEIEDRQIKSPRIETIETIE